MDRSVTGRPGQPPVPFRSSRESPLISSVALFFGSPIADSPSAPNKRTAEMRRAAKGTLSRARSQPSRMPQLAGSERRPPDQSATEEIEGVSAPKCAIGVDRATKYRTIDRSVEKARGTFVLAFPRFPFAGGFAELATRRSSRELVGGGGRISYVPGDPRLGSGPALRPRQDRQQQALRCRAERATPPRLTTANKCNYFQITRYLV